MVATLGGVEASSIPPNLDAIVIGGGITGVCIARELAARARSVLLLDRGDFGAGTSSATTKYLHGGIRYLEQYDVALVRESLRERRRFALAAPHLVSQRKFALPVWRWTKPGRFLLGAGAVAYDALSFDRNRSMPESLKIGHPRWMGRSTTLAAIPWLQPNHLRGAVVISDTLNVHPERLLLALLLDAVNAGAYALNHVAVTGFMLEPGSDRQGVRGVVAEDQLTGERHTFRSRTVINAAGPWLADVLATLDHKIGPKVRPSKGVHILTKPMSETSQMAVMARARNGRHVVVSPWQSRLFIGPTDTPEDRSPDDVVTDGDDVDDILNVVNDCRGEKYQLSTDDVADTTMGIRPLIADPTTADSSKLSRQHQLDDHAVDGVAGLYSVLGGKWTTGRATAEDIVDHIFGPEHRKATRNRPVAGVPGWAVDPEEVFAHVRHRSPESGCSPSTREHLARLYGTRSEMVLNLVAERPELGEPVSERRGCEDILAQVAIAVTIEGARTLDDIVQRRLVLGTLGQVPFEDLARVARVAAPLLGWPDHGKAQAQAEFRRRAANRARWSTH